MIMVIVVLTVYKSCIKNRQFIARRDLNETYAQIISDGSDQNMSSSIFPPPPPSYSFAVQNTSKGDPNLNKRDTHNHTEITNSETLILPQTESNLVSLVTSSK